MKNLVWAAWFALGCFALSAATPPTWRYILVHDSDYLNDCLICGRPTIIQPLRGQFDLVLSAETATNRSYLVTNLSWVTRSDPAVAVSGYGTLRFEFGGKTNQEITLYAKVNGQPKVFTNDIENVTRLWPMIALHVVQTQVNLVSFDSMDLVAAPVRELWFTTAQDFFSTNLSRTVLAGDLVSKTGQIVKEQDRQTILAGAGIRDSVPLDSLTVAPGAEVLFSVRSNTMATSGPVHHGDVLSARRGLLFSNSALTAGFQPQPANSDPGLDALYVSDDGQIYFSTTSDFISGQLGAVSGGDLLAFNPNGDAVPNRRVKTSAELLANLHPLSATSPGLDALYLWPSGEIWFSTEQDFNSQSYGLIAHGDLLSDQGQIIFREKELIEAFGTAAINRGLSAIFVVTDAMAPAPVAPRITQFVAHRLSGGTTTSWLGSNRVYQVQKSPTINGAYQPASDILPTMQWTEPGLGVLVTEADHRLRAW